LLLLVLPLATILLTAPANAASKKPQPSSELVDAGSFSILVAGRKIGSETFNIRQSSEGSVTSSEIRIQEGGSQARQTSVLRLGPAGELRRYESRELFPGKAEIVVEPQQDVLVERVSGENEQANQPFLMPLSTQVLDDFFFSHREVLAWRYLASVCKPAAAGLQCSSQKSRLGVIIPRQHASAMISLEYVGRERLTLAGQPVELSHFRLTAPDAPDWELWLDDFHKLVRISIPAANTEGVRDTEPQPKDVRQPRAPAEQ
jgi:hypothetical protein